MSTFMSVLIVAASLLTQSSELDEHKFSSRDLLLNYRTVLDFGNVLDSSPVGELRHYRGGKRAKAEWTYSGEEHSVEFTIGFALWYGWPLFFDNAMHMPDVSQAGFPTICFDRAKSNTKLPFDVLTFTNTSNSNFLFEQKSAIDARKDGFKGSVIDAHVPDLPRAEYVKEDVWRFHNSAEQLILPLTKNARQQTVRMRCLEIGKDEVLLKVMPEEGEAVFVTVTALNK